MEIIIAVVIGGFAIIGIASMLYRPIAAGNTGNKLGSAFSQTYKLEFGVLPSAEAEKAITSGVTVIYSAMGSGQYSFPSQNLQKCINEYGEAVLWDEKKMELGLGCLLAICGNKNGQVAPGCKWAAELIAHNMQLYCPTMIREVLGY